MEKITREQFIERLGYCDSKPLLVSHVSRMVAALRAYDDKWLQASGDEFDDQIEFLNYRIERKPEESIDYFREIVSNLLEDGYGRIFNFLCPPEPAHAANVNA